MGNCSPIAIFLAASALLAAQATDPSAALAGEGEEEAGGLKEWTTDQPVDDVGENGEGEGESEDAAEVPTEPEVISRRRDDNEAEPFDEETVTSLEAGLKGAWFDERLVFNAAAFRNDYQDMQTSSFGSANASFIAIFSNAGEAVTQGLELEMRGRPTPNLQLRLHLGYLDAEYKEYDAPNLGTGEIQDLSGLDLIQAPEFTYGLGLRWRLISNELGRLTLNGQYSGSSSYFTTVMNEASLKEGGYGLLNLSLRWDNPRNGLSVSLSAANLTDERYIIHGFDLLSYPGVALAYNGAPRTYGLSVSWDY